MENSERLGRQARPGIEPDTSRPRVFERRTAQPLVGARTDSLTSMPYPEPLVEQLASLVTTPLGRRFLRGNFAVVQSVLKSVICFEGQYPQR